MKFTYKIFHCLQAYVLFLLISVTEVTTGFLFLLNSVTEPKTKGITLTLSNAKPRGLEDFIIHLEFSLIMTHVTNQNIGYINYFS